MLMEKINVNIIIKKIVETVYLVYSLSDKNDEYKYKYILEELFNNQNFWPLRAQNILAPAGGSGVGFGPHHFCT